MGIRQMLKFSPWGVKRPFITSFCLAVSSIRRASHPNSLKQPPKPSIIWALFRVKTVISNDFVVSACSEFTGFSFTHGLLAVVETTFTFCLLQQDNARAVRERNNIFFIYLKFKWIYVSCFAIE